MTRWRRWLAAIALGQVVGGLPWGAAQATPIVPQAESATQVQATGDAFIITGGVGSADGQALFHAFEQLGLSAGQVATFLVQPEVQSILGGVVGGEASYIDGLLQVVGSSADLYLINPAGILFGPNAQLDLAGSFAATTASGVLFDDALFNVLGGGDFSQLTGTPTGFVWALDAAGAIANMADLTVTPGESITLIGGQVVSTGTLTAPGGEITIAAIPEANLVRLSHPDWVLSLEMAPLPTGTAIATAITPLTLPALLTGAPTSLATDLAVQADGTIALISSDATFAPVSGSAIATGTLDTAGATGGSVTVVGDRVSLIDATVNASGDMGGGTVRLGGDRMGQPTLPGSTLTDVDGGSAIAAEARQTGDGGTVILWSDQTTAFYGDISARGGPNGGDGGFVEVSGADTLIYRGTADAIAPAGQTGTLLLDPIDITIRDGTADGDDADADANTLAETTIVEAAPAPTVIYESELANIAGSADLVLQASNNITIEDLADNTLTLPNDGEATPGSITFAAGNRFQMLDPNDVIAAPRRSLTITANTIEMGGIDTADFSARGGNVSLTADGAIATGDILTAGDAIGGGSGDVVITGSQITTGRIAAGGGFANPSRVALTATTSDIIVDTIAAGGGGVDIDAAGLFQARDSFIPDPASSRAELVATDAELIDFLMRGEPQPLFDAGLVGSGLPVFIAIPTSILTSPTTAGDGPITIRHGGQAATLVGDELTIAGTGANPEVQFVVGPNNDHTINIDATATPATANFSGFTPLFSTAAFPADVSGTTGAIIRLRGDAVIVTSFQNQPFVPVVSTPEVNVPESGSGGTVGGGTVSGGPADTGAGGGDPGVGAGGNAGSGTSAIAPGRQFETATFENLSPDDTENVEALAATEDAVLPSDAGALDAGALEDCEAAIAHHSDNAVEITSTCTVPTSAEQGDF